MSPVIEARGLIKRYGQFPAVDGIDLTVEKGEVFGLLGPNGSGKTTTILLLLGLTEPTAGSIRVLGLDPLRQPLTVKRRVGYLPDQIGFYDHLTAHENLVYSARLGGIVSDEANRRIGRSLNRVRLADVANRRVATFSRGMKTFPSVSSSTHKRMMAAAASLAIAGAIGFGAYATGTTPVLADAVRVQTAQMPGFADLVERVTPAVVSVKVKAKVQSTADDGSDDQNGFDNLPDNPQLRRFFKEFRGFGDQGGQFGMQTKHSE